MSTSPGGGGQLPIEVVLRFEQLDRQLAELDAKLDASEQRRSRKKTTGPYEREMREQARQAKYYADLEAKAQLAALGREERARRETAKIAAQMRRDEELAAKRAAKEEERAFVAALKAEERQRRETAKIAAALYRDQEREAKRAAAEQLRAAQSRYTSVDTGGGLGGAASTLGLDTMLSRLASVYVAVQAIEAAWHLVAAAIELGVDALASFIATGLKYNQTLETSERSIAALVAQYYTITDAQGHVLQGADKINGAFQISKELIEELRIAAAKTPLTFEELLAAMQQVVVYAGQAGVKTKDLVPLTTNLATAVKTLGLNSAQVTQEIRGLLSGDINRNTTLANQLRITSAMVEQWKQQGVFAEKLNERLAVFAAVSQAAAGDFDVITSNLEDLYNATAGLATAGLFDELKEAGAILITGLVDPVKSEFSPAVKEIVAFLNAELTEFGGDARTLAEYLVRRVNDIADFIRTNRAQLDAITATTRLLLQEVGGLVDDWIELVFGAKSHRNELDATLSIVNGMRIGIAFLRDATILMHAYVLRIGSTLRAVILVALDSGKYLVAVMRGDVVGMAENWNAAALALERYEDRLKRAREIEAGATHTADAQGAEPKLHDTLRKFNAQELQALAGANTGLDDAADKAKKLADEAAKLYDTIAEKQRQYALENKVLQANESGYAAERSRVLADQLEQQRQIQVLHDKLVASGKSEIEATLAQVRLNTELNNLVTARLAALEQNERARQQRAYVSEVIAAGGVPTPADGGSLGPPLIGAAREAANLHAQLLLIDRDVRETYGLLNEQQQLDIIRIRQTEAIADAAERHQKAEQEVLDALSKQLETQLQIGQLPGGVTGPEFDPTKVNVPVPLEPPDPKIEQGLLSMTNAAFQAAGGWAYLGQSAGQALAGMLNGTLTIGEAIRSFVFNLIGDILIQLGQAAIAAGAVASAAPFLFGLSGGAAIAAGIAAIAVGTAIKGLAGGGGSYGQELAAQASAPPVASYAPPRKRKIRGGEFETSGESTVRRPGYFGPGGANAIQMQITLKGGDKISQDLIDNGFVTVQNAGKLGVITVDSLNRGSTRRRVKRKLEI